LEKTQVEEREVGKILKVLQPNFVIIDDTFTQVMEEMKNVAV
jgi:hypothetical protein